jgi:predicted LPLAT superfamily acyltransferase
MKEFLNPFAPLYRILAYFMLFNRASMPARRASSSHYNNV